MDTNISDISIHERSTVVIDLGAVRENVAAFKRLQSERRNKPMLILCTLKANAYGHGAVQIGKSISDLADYLGAACVDEGAELRRAGITNPILIFGAELSDNFETAVTNSLTLTVFDIKRAKELNECAVSLGQKAAVHIAVDTGMSRIGLKPDESGIDIIKQISALSNIEITGVFTHFATADEEDKVPAMEAHKRFADFKRLCEANDLRLGVWHCANTAATIDDIGLESDMDMSRCGIGVYGLYPSDEVHKEYIALKPALKWYSCVSYVKEIKAGTKVSYGYNYTAPKDMLVGTVACGYADGYRRILSKNGAEVIIRGRRCPVIGTICMDQMMVDLTNAPDTLIGDRAVLIGNAEDSFAGNADNICPKDMSSLDRPITVDELAEKCGTISYEIICAITSRTKRRYQA